MEKISFAVFKRAAAGTRARYNASMRNATHHNVAEDDSGEAGEDADREIDEDALIASLMLGSAMEEEELEREGN